MDNFSKYFKTIFFGLLAATLATVGAASPSLLDAGREGGFNIGDSKAEVSRTNDAERSREVLKVDYHIAPAAVAGVWIKDFPPEVKAGQCTTLSMSTRIEAPPTGVPVALSLELKGTKNTQVVPLEAHPSWQLTQVPIDWSRIGALEEVVAMITHQGTAHAVSGAFFLDAEFVTPSIWQKTGSMAVGRIALALTLALGAGWLVALFSGTRTRKDTASNLPVAGFVKDLLVGIALALLFGLAYGLYTIAASTPPGAGLARAAFGVVGAIIAGLLKKAFTGSGPTPSETFQSALVTGLLAATAGTTVLWQAPQRWADLLQLSFFGAGLFILLYHAVNFYLLSVHKRHLGRIGAGCFLATPYVFGLLLALQSTDLMAGLGHPLVGRVLLLFVVNEFVVNGFALVTRRRLVQGAGIHAWVFLPALATVIAPSIADFGSGEIVAAWPPLLRSVSAVVCTMLSQAALWAEAFMVTGIMIDGMRGVMPDRNVVIGNARSGLIKGAVFSGILMALLQGLGLAVSLSSTQWLFQQLPLMLFTMGGALLFPLMKTVIESFDGSQSFFRRVRQAYGDPVLYGRGLVTGLAFGLALSLNLQGWSTPARFAYGAVAGLAAFAGMSYIRDLILSAKQRGGPKTWRLYLVEGLLGAFIGAALAFYLDAAQIPIILKKFELYTCFGMDPNLLVAACGEVRTTRPDEFRALLNQWGYIQLSAVQGGAKFLFNEALIGVSVWGIAAWLFAVNRAFLQAFFDKAWAPVKRIPTREGLADLVEGTIHVTRWGLWMSPIIFTFLRPMADPTWYNQDGAIRTLFATAHSLFMDPAAFREWSLGVFLGILVYGSFRVLIFLDHMGLRVATLVNLSFVGMDRLDERLARFIGPAATGLYIPEGVKRFTTWAPLLIPFYLPAGAEWARVWDESQAVLAARSGELAALPSLGWYLTRGAVLALGLALLSALIRWLRSRKAGAGDGSLRITNVSYEVVAKPSGEITSSLYHKGIGLNRPSFETADPAGRVLFLAEGTARAWPVVGNYPGELYPAAACVRNGEALVLTQTHNEVTTTVRITLPNRDDAVERWDIRVENLSGRPRGLQIIPYLEWLLCEPGMDRNHTQYNRLYPEMSYDRGLNAVLALHRYTKQYGFLAAGSSPVGFLTGRIDFIGRAGTIWNPRVLKTQAFQPCRDTEAVPTFDPIGSLLLPLKLEPQGTAEVSLLMGCTDSREQAVNLIQTYLQPEAAPSPVDEQSEARHPLIGHGEILPGTPDVYADFVDQGKTLQVHTPFTPRPFDHTMTNAIGHTLCVTNRGLHSSASVNAQQNRLTTDWADLVGREMPAEAIYLYDEDHQAWFAPTYEPLRDPETRHDVRFGLDGSATFVMQKGDVETELITHVPVNDPAGVYLLTVRNHGTRARRFRVAPYFQIALAHSPEMAVKIKKRFDSRTGVLYFENAANTFRKGPAFVAMSEPVQGLATERGSFFGAGRSFAHPRMLEEGRPAGASNDHMACAAFLSTLEIPPGGEHTLVVLLGQADTRSAADTCIAKLASVEAAQQSLAETRQWWLAYNATLTLETSNPDFEAYVQWMKYQALAERIWARKGFYQASGAFGFRDQLQDTVNLIWVDSRLARKQLILHAGQQFLEGDVAHWFFCQQDGRTGFLNRSHASDNLLWLGWGVSEYVRMTGDATLLDEQVSYLKSETPLPPLPQGKHGMGFIPHRSPLADSIYEHVLRAIDLVFEKRLGRNRLPLILTGDWNDGMDEIGSEGRGESIWLAFFLIYILNQFLDVIEQRSGAARRAAYDRKLADLKQAVEQTWRKDRYLRAIHDDGTEIGVEGAGYWETDALTAAWAVYAGVNPARGRTAVDTALRVLERDNVICLGYPALREDTQPYLGRSSRYPEGVRENGMYSHGVQWLVRACRILAEQFAEQGDEETARIYRDASARLWLKIAAISHVTPEEIEVYGGQPNKQCADYLTKYDTGRMIWNGYTGAAAWMLRQAVEGVLGYTLDQGKIIAPADLDQPRGDLVVKAFARDVSGSPLGK